MSRVSPIVASSIAARIDIAADDLQRVLAILERHVADCVVRVFGSRATHTAKRFSDLDLVVMGEVPLSSTVLAAMRDDFDESDLPFKVDIVDWATTSESFRKIIDAGAILIAP